MIIIGAIIGSIVIYLLISCYNIQNDTVEQIVYFADIKHEDPYNYDSAKISCQSGTVVSTGQQVCVRLSDDTLIFIPKDRIFTKKFNLKKHYGLKLTNYEQDSKYRVY